jgi:hypothetical protein
VLSTRVALCGSLQLSKTDLSKYIIDDLSLDVKDKIGILKKYFHRQARCDGHDLLGDNHTSSVGGGTSHDTEYCGTEIS